jgi:L-asparagine oxygenase
MKSGEKLQLSKDDVARHGFAFVRKYRLGTDSATIASELGRPLIPWEGGLVQELSPRARAVPNTYSGIYGLARFPFHTDLAHWRSPPRYLMLRCMKGYDDIPTLLFDGQTLIESDLLDLLTRAVVKPRRPLNGAITLLRLCEVLDEGYRLRWDEVFLKPASRVGEIADQRIRERLAQGESITISLSTRGDTLLIDNWRMLHARSPVPIKRQDRKIERVYLEGLI